MKGLFTKIPMDEILDHLHIVARGFEKQEPVPCAFICHDDVGVRKYLSASTEPR